MPTFRSPSIRRVRPNWNRCAQPHIVTVTAKPTASFNLQNFSACTSSNTVTLINCSTSAANYTWDFGDGIGSNATNPTHTYSVVGTYTITLTATNTNGCVDTMSKTVTLITKPTAAFAIGSNSTQCIGGNSFSFVNNSTNATTYVWNFEIGRAHV